MKHLLRLYSLLLISMVILFITACSSANELPAEINTFADTASQEQSTTLEAEDNQWGIVGECLGACWRGDNNIWTSKRYILL